MAGEIQVNSVTALTESGSNIVLNNVDTATNRTNLGLGSIATQAADSVSISGGNITGGTIGSSVVFPADHIIKVESVIKTSVFTTTSTSFTDVTGLSVGITPASTSNKILVMCSFFISSNSGSGYAQAKIVRNGSDVYVGDAAGSRRRGLLNAVGYNSDSNYVVPVSVQFLDSPASTSLQTYKVQCLQTAGNTTRIGAVGSDSDSTNSVRSASSIVLLEING